jgi:phage tail tape-measure protein
MQRERDAVRGTRETHASQESVMRNEKSKMDAAKSSAKRLEHEAEGAAAGAFAGALVGACAGPPGVIAGAILGGAAGAMVGRVMDAQASADVARTRELDAVIGVSGGDMGAPNLTHPPAEDRCVLVGFGRYRGLKGGNAGGRTIPPRLD